MKDECVKKRRDASEAKGAPEMIIGQRSSTSSFGDSKLVGPAIDDFARAVPASRFSSAEWGVIDPL